MEQEKDIKDAGHIFGGLTEDEANILRAERAEMRAEREARLKEETDKEFEPKKQER